MSTPDAINLAVGLDSLDQAGLQQPQLTVGQDRFTDQDLREAPVVDDDTPELSLSSSDHPKYADALTTSPSDESPSEIRPTGRLRRWLSMPSHRRNQRNEPKELTQRERNLLAKNPVDPETLVLIHRRIETALATYLDTSSPDCHLLPKDPKAFNIIHHIQQPKLAVHGFVAYSETHEEIIIALRGTTSTDWRSFVQDVKVLQTPWPQMWHGSKVHSGMLQMAEKAFADVEHTIASLKFTHPEARIVCDGHSLGAAVVFLTCLKLAIKYPAWHPDFDMALISGPMVGNSQFVTYYNALNIPTILVNNGKDFIPSLPGQKLGYYHVAGEIYIYPELNLAVYCPMDTYTLERDPDCSRAVTFRGSKMLDHRLYFKHISRMFRSEDMTAKDREACNVCSQTQGDHAHDHADRYASLEA
ncbi:hypothetical protein IWQ60_002291 [Tieghemiomyces parasiticus]|uniref:Fungal lipase-type domain-containing protein n=1 Tax=Tieghemiomyces parasiticus TaxID=78921 RepID=A0A9W8E142_9FUNG|nr:hypothetical protein IWQ60_002291 [Tieghemiomyces parasiticus]